MASGAEVQRGQVAIGDIVGTQIDRDEKKIIVVSIRHIEKRGFDKLIGHLAFDFFCSVSDWLNLKRFYYLQYSKILIMYLNDELFNKY